MSQVSDNQFDFLSIAVEEGVRYCFDDSYIVDPLAIERDPFILARLARPVFVDKMTPTVKQYNRMSMSSSPILEKIDFDDSKIDASQWNIPESYKQLSVVAITERLLKRQEQEQLEDDLIDQRNARIVTEMRAYKQEDKIELIRLMCYIVDQLTANNQIWGVGRGSSVSSYVLFLLGVHDIDSVLYDLDFTDFMKSK